MANVHGLVELVKENEVARSFFERSANVTRNMRETTVENVQRKAGCSYPDGRAFLRSCESLGYGHYRNRTGNKSSRIEWLFPFTEIVAIANGTRDDTSGMVPIDDEEPFIAEEQEEELDFTIPYVKENLAEMLGVEVESIQIIINA